MSPQAVRVRTSSGWQDIAIQGPPGPQGPAAPIQSPFVICANIQANTLPRSYPFTLPAAITSAVLVVNCTGFPTSAPGRFAIGFNIDAGSGGSQCNCYGTRVEHISLPTGLFQVGPLAAGVHNLTLRNDLNAVMDTNDYLTAYLDAVVIADPKIPQIVTTLPATPVDGQEVYYQVDATNGVIWHLRYNAASASAYKWEYLGGPPLRGYYATNENIPTTWSSGQPSITVPRAGEYDVDWSCDVNSPGQSQNYIAFYLDAVRVDAIVSALFMTANPQEATGAERNRIAIAAGQVVSMGFVRSGAAVSSAKNRSLMIKPVRIS